MNKSQEKALQKFVKDRDKAITRAVMNDDWEAAKRYCRKYGVPVPGNERIFKGAIYKAACEVLSLSQEVRGKAKTEAEKLGFYPGLRRS